MADLAATMGKRFGVADYVVFALTVVISAAIGIYFAFVGGKQKSTKEFLHADGKMSLIPVTLSLTVSVAVQQHCYLSANSVLGIPSEIYTHGTLFVWKLFGYFIAMALASSFFLPVYCELKLTSVFEYVEMRFNGTLRILACILSMLTTTMYLSLVLYTPSLGLSIVTGINLWVTVTVLGVVTTVYTTVGGMKAVLWTDSFQAAIMVAGMLAVAIAGTVDQGVSTIWMNGVEGGRMNVFNWSEALDPNPMTRHTIWSLVIGTTLVYTAVYGNSQTVIQRAMCLSSLRKAQISFWLNIPGLLFVLVMGCSAGIMIYSHYKDCDPLSSGAISRLDQLYPLYVMEVLGDYPGLPGLVVAGAFSGAISTVSSGLNSLAAIALSDIVKRLIKPDITDEKAAFVSKFLCAGFGLLSICIAFVYSSARLILQVGSTISGILGGPSFGICVAGLFFPCVNSTGAIAGLIISLGLTSWIGFGGMFARKYTPKLPVSIEGCSALNYTLTSNFTASSSLLNVTSATAQSVEALIAESRSGIGALYNISYQWIALIGLCCFLLTSLVVSAISGNNAHSSLDEKLFSPLVIKLRKCAPKQLSMTCFGAIRLRNGDTVQKEDDEFKMELKEN